MATARLWLPVALALSALSVSVVPQADDDTITPRTVIAVNAGGSTVVDPVIGTVFEHDRYDTPPPPPSPSAPSAPSALLVPCLESCTRAWAET
jgi:hypothetical protein